MPSDRERYSDAIDRCRAMARATPDAGCQQLWTTVADSYRCLYDNEMRTESEARDRAQRIAQDAQSSRNLAGIGSV